MCTGRVFTYIYYLDSFRKTAYLTNFLIRLVRGSCFSSIFFCCGVLLRKWAKNINVLYFQNFPLTNASVLLLSFFLIYFVVESFVKSLWKFKPIIQNDAINLTNGFFSNLHCHNNVRKRNFKGSTSQVFRHKRFDPS